MSKFDPIKKEVEEVVAAYKKSGKITTVSQLFSFVYGVSGHLVEVVEISKAIVKENKKDTVIEAVKYAYDQINPDLPWIPEPLESYLENWFFANGLPALIDFIVGRYNAHGIFEHTEPKVVSAGNVITEAADLPGPELEG